MPQAALARTRRPPSGRLKGLGRAGVVGLDAPPVDDHAATDGDPVGLSVPSGLPVAEVSSARTHAVQPGPCRSRRGGETRTWRGFDAATKTESSFSRTICLTSGGSDGGGPSALARMNFGTGARLSAMPQPASTSAPAVKAV